MKQFRMNKNYMYSCGIAHVTLCAAGKKKYKVLITQANNDFIELYHNTFPKNNLTGKLPGISVKKLIGCKPLQKTNPTHGSNHSFEWHNPRNQRYYIIYVYPHPPVPQHGSLHSSQNTPSGGSEPDAPGNSNANPGSTPGTSRHSSQNTPFGGSEPDAPEKTPQSSTNQIQQAYTLLYIDNTQSKILGRELIRTRQQYEQLNQQWHEMLNHERARISAELHDHIGQALTAIKLDLDWLNNHEIIKNIKNNPCSKKISSIMKLTDNTMRITQQIAAGLLPGIPADLGLIVAAREYCKGFMKRTGISCAFESNIGYAGNGQTALELYRIMQEALTNVARHAQANRVEVRIMQQPGGVELTVADNGTGMPEHHANNAQAIGLNGMKRRAAQCGGEIFFNENKNGGTIVRVHIPLNLR